MEVTQRLQSVQDEACMIFEEIEGQGSQLDQDGHDSRTMPGRACYRAGDSGVRRAGSSGEASKSRQLELSSRPLKQHLPRSE
jgi:hypothetical protein